MPPKPSILDLCDGPQLDHVRRVFFSKVEPIPECGCWLWTGALLSTGYGQLSYQVGAYRTHHAHRLAWELHRGKIPAGAHLCHSCDRHWCVNPAHLSLGNMAVNIGDMSRKWRGAKNLKTGLPFGVRRNGARWTAATRTGRPNGLVTYLGTFDTVAEAHEVALRAKCEHYGCGIPEAGHPSILPDIGEQLRAVYGTESRNAWATR